MRKLRSKESELKFKPKACLAIPMKYCAFFGVASSLRVYFLTHRWTVRNILHELSITEQQITPPNSSFIQKKKILFFYSLCDQESGHSVVEWLWFKVSHEITVKVSDRAAVSYEGSTGGRWWDLLLGSFTWLLAGLCLQTWTLLKTVSAHAPGFSQRANPKVGKDGHSRSHILFIT